MAQPELKRSAGEALSRTERVALEVARDPILAMMLEQERVESEELDRGLFWRLLANLKRHPGLTATCLGLSVVEAILLTLPPYAVGLAIDQAVRTPGGADRTHGLIATALRASAERASALAPASFAPVEALVIGFGVVIMTLVSACWFLASLTSYLMQKLGQQTVHDLRVDVFLHLSGMDLGFFHKNPVGRLVNRTTFDVQTLSEFFADTLAQGVRDVLFLCVLVVVMLTLDVPLTLVILSTFPLLVIAGAWYRREVRPAMRTTSAVLSRMNAWMAENIAGMRENQLYRTETRRRAEYANLTDAHQASVTSWIRAWATLRPAVLLCSALATAGVLAMGHSRVGAGIISVGVLLTFLQYTARLWGPVRNLMQRFAQIQSAFTAAERVFDILGKRAAIKDAPDADPALEVTQGAIRFEDVTFAYPGKEDPALRGVDIDLKPGEMLALVGDTGAGKSTIVHLLSRFYDVTEGALQIDGRDVRDYTLRNLRRGIAIVPQDVTIFAGSIRDNITLGLDATDDEILACARAVQADRLIDRFDDGLDHQMDEAGRTLSAGERQLISFARALLFNPPVLILDEATSNIDTETEALIQSALAELTRGRTSVVVAHRLSTIRDADQILVLRDGQITERGTHDELLAAGGTYAALSAEFSSSASA